jgi:hypothetical protein
MHYLRPACQQVSRKPMSQSVWALKHRPWLGLNALWPPANTRHQLPLFENMLMLAVKSWFYELPNK